MTINDFNSKINLPEVYIHSGTPGYQFTKLPVFGWFAHNHDKSVIAAVYDFVKPTNISIYQYYTINKPELQEFKFDYSELTDNRYQTSYQVYLEWRQAWLLAQQEAREAKVYHHTYVKFTDLAEHLGYKHIFDAQIGLVTEKVLKAFRHLPWPADSKNKLMVPSFCTPKHNCSFELASIFNPEERQTIYTNGEKGWYGKLNSHIAKNLTEAITLGGNTWDYKCDYWNDMIIDISPNVSISDRLEMWMNSNRTSFKESPIKAIVDSGQIDLIKNHITNLSYERILDLEKELGQELVPHWEQLNDKEVNLNNLKFLKRKDKYYIQRLGISDEFANFTMEYKTIVKKGAKFYRKGHIHHKGVIVPFEMDNAYFNSSKLLTRKLREFFVEAGLGLPAISTHYQHYLRDVIEKFNPNVSVEGERGAELSKHPNAL